MGQERRGEEDGDRLRRWESVVDRAIQEAQARGEFDDLPGHGKPMRLEENPVGGDRAMGFRILKNAGMLPERMERERELAAEAAALEALRERTAEWLRLEAARAVDAGGGDRAEGGKRARAGRRGCWPFGRGEETPEVRPGRPRFSVAALEAERMRARRDYLARAARLDEKVVRYNNSLPDELRWRERVRLTPAQAAATFDATCRTWATNGAGGKGLGQPGAAPS